MQRPARLVLRLSDRGLADVMGDGAPVTLAQWRQLLVSSVGWLGPSRVTLISTGGAFHPMTSDLLRFTHRLECHVGLITDGSGIDRARADELVDRGLAWVRVLVGGVSDGVQREVVGNSAQEATEAVQALVSSRDDRRAPLDVEVGIPWCSQADAEARAIIGWARQVGADGFRLVAPHLARDMPADPELLDAISDELPPFNRTASATIRELHTMVAHQDGQPGMLRKLAPAAHRRGRCPVGGQRLEITANGRAHCCPFKEPIGRIEDTLEATWAHAGGHLREIRACGRACAHVELAVEPLLG